MGIPFEDESVYFLALSAAEYSTAINNMKVCFFFDQVNEKGPYCNYLKLHFIKMNGKVGKDRKA
jgi:hypothetical protein